MYGCKKKKNSNLLRWTHCAKQKRVGETWEVKVRKMMGMFNVGCRSCCGSDLFVVRYLKLFFPRRKGDGSGSWLSVLRCSPMRDTSNTLSTCQKCWLHAAMMILSCFSIVCSFLDLGVRIGSSLISFFSVTAVRICRSALHCVSSSSTMQNRIMWSVFFDEEEILLVRSGSRFFFTLHVYPSCFIFADLCCTRRPVLMV